MLSVTLPLPLMRAEGVGLPLRLIETLVLGQPLGVALRQSVTLVVCD